MSRRFSFSRVAIFTLTLGAALACGGALRAQDPDPDPDPDPGPSTVGAAGTSGVAIDADGVLRRKFRADPTGQLTRQRFAEQWAALDRDIARPSKLRKVSLTRLEAALQVQLADGRAPTDAMRHLAGLTRIRYVFYYPETRDVVIAGPAEGWGRDLTDRAVGLKSGKPVLELQDMAVALRAFPPGGRPGGPVVCSIDPTPEGLQRMQQFLAQLGGRATPRDTQFIVNGLRTNLGLQKVMVGGISPKTHFAQVMVEADYRMKLIGIGLERPPVKIVSYVEKASPSSVARNAMQRWYFVPNYECVRASEDGLAMRLEGDGVKLVGEHEVVQADGSRLAAGRIDRASQVFVNSFTRAYPELARKSPVYGQLRNLIDMLVASAFIQKQDYYGKAGWSLEVLGSEQQFPVEVLNAPQQAPTAVNSLWKGNRLMTPVGGGVQINAIDALQPDSMLADEEGQVREARAAIDLKALPQTTWWWD